MQTHMTLMHFGRRLVGTLLLLLGLGAGFGGASPITTNVVTVNTTASREIFFSNLSASTYTNVVFSNTLASTLDFVSVQASTGSLATVIRSNPAVLLVSTLDPTNRKSIFSYTFRPTQIGYYTNRTTATVTNPVVSSSSLDVIFKVVNTLSDLAVGISGPSTVQLEGDRISYTIGLTNRGPAVAPSVVLSNFFGLGGTVRSVSSVQGNTSVADVTRVVSATNLTVNVGNLVSNASIRFQVVLDVSTNLGSYDFVSTAFSTSLANGDPASANDCATNSFVVTNALPGVTALQADPLPNSVDVQTGLFTQRVRVSNTGATPLQSVRLTVHGLVSRTNALSDVLYNAVGTNQGNPFVVSPASLAPGQDVDFQLEFFFPARQPATGLSYTASEVPSVNVTNTLTSVTPLSLTNWWTGSAMVLEFPATLGKYYTIQYSDSVSFTNALNALPTVQAYANRVQWVDSGPPKTISPPVNGSRFYRVIATP